MSRLLVGLFWLGSACVCGVANASESVVVAAQPLLEAAPSSRSDVVAVLASRGVAEQLCTGTVLLPNLVMTARHCLTTDRSAIESGDCSSVIPAGDEQTRIAVVPGNDVDLVPEDGRHTVRELLLPEGEGRICGQDLALLLLDTPITGTESSFVEVTTEVPSAPADFTAVGYGLYDGDWGQQRQRADAHYSCRGAACADERIAGNELLAQSGACEGDSGGPALDASGKLFGIVSRSTADCGESAYLELGSYAETLKAAVQHAATAGSYEVPAWVEKLGSPGDSDPEVPAVEPQDLRSRGGCNVAAARKPNAAIRWLIGLISVAMGARRVKRKS